MWPAMPAVAGPVLAFAVLLVIGGAGKLRRPDDTVRALRALRLPVSPLAVRLLAVTEMAIGMATLVFGGRTPTLLVAASYLAFAAFVLLAMARRGAVSSCGCFGTPDTPPTAAHLVVTLAASALAFAAAADPLDPLLGGLGGQPLLGVPFLLLTGCCAWFAYLALSALPRLAALARAEP